MDADERLMALKKAYAEIILNTAKEAAARIMVSERKAIRFEYELKHAKEEAIRMFSRLKQMMDLKVSEAAVKSCTQEKKIQELEAQLQEAEDIVKDLREELKAVEAELARFSRTKEVKHMVQVDNAPAREPITLPQQEAQPSSCIDQTNKSRRILNSLFPLKKSVIGNGDYLPSIILRSKETALYRNGCTQRIRACEQKLQNTVNTPDERSSVSVQNDDVNKIINLKLSLREDEVQMIDVAADNSCLTSRDSVKHTKDTPIDENLVRTLNGQSTSGEGVMCKKQEKDEVDPSLVSAESKVCKTVEVPSQPLTNRVFKYTFQRKRKRGALIGGSEGSHENRTALAGSVKVNSTGESTPEKIRVAQDAQQLTPLSAQNCG